MKKIIVIGSCGAGKTTFSKKLSERLSLPLISLDQFYWRPNWERTPREEWRVKVRELVEREEWVMDGNLQDTFDIRFPECDTIILIDMNRFVCFWRIWKRRILKNRHDKLDNCDEHIDFYFMKWVLWVYPNEGRKNIFEFVEKHKDKKVVILKSRKELVDIDKVVEQIR